MGLRLITPPAVYPLDLARAKSHLQLLHDADDADVQEYIEAATEWLEGHTRRAFIQRRYEFVPGCWPGYGGKLLLPKPPTIAVVSVQYIDGAGVTQTWAPGDWLADLTALPARIYPAPGKDWPLIADRHDAITVTMDSGYGATAGDVPTRARQCIKLLTAHQYAIREPVSIGASGSELPLGLRTMASTLRVKSLP